MVHSKTYPKLEKTKYSEFIRGQDMKKSADALLSGSVSLKVTVPDNQQINYVYIQVSVSSTVKILHVGSKWGLVF